MSGSEQFLLGFFGNAQLCGANVFDFHCRCAVDVDVVVVPCHRAADSEFVFGQDAVFDPEFG